jgi:hypothetical protein
MVIAVHEQMHVARTMPTTTMMATVTWLDEPPLL